MSCLTKKYWHYLSLGVPVFLITVFFSGCFTYHYVEKDLFEPQKETELTSLYQFERFFITTCDSVEIESWWLSREDAELTIFFLPGNSWNLRHRIPAFNMIASRIKANIFAVNYRGYGLSSGEPTVDGICRDGEAAMSFFREHLQPKHELPLYILGFSLGTYISLCLATHHPCDGIILLAAFTCADDVIDDARKKRIPAPIRPFVRIKLDSCLYKLDNLTLVSHISQPILFAHGIRDPYIPVWMSKSLHRSCSAPQKSLALIDGNHFLMNSPAMEAVLDEIAEFIKATSSTARELKKIFP